MCTFPKAFICFLSDRGPAWEQGVVVVVVGGAAKEPSGGRGLFSHQHR